MKQVKVIGAGLAGCECAFQLAERGVKVKLYEMKPKVMSPAHKSENFAELVCSNTFKSESLNFASGLLKQELAKMGSLIIDCAKQTKIPAGDVLAVDRDKFSSLVTDKIKNHSNIEIIHEEVDKIDSGEVTIIATGPLTSKKLTDALKGYVGEYLYFYDALAPIVDVEKIDKSKIFVEDRYGSGESYINCSLTEEEYKIFWQELVNAERVELKDFEKNFEGCLPVEVMAKRGYDVLRFGPMKPEGFKKQKPFAVLQLRKENVKGNLYNLVGCQTNLTYKEQKRVFSLIPALKNVDFVRYGAMHRNSFINAPKLMKNTLNLKSNENIFFAGQLSGVEGYVESIASGLLCAYYVLQYLNGEKIKPLSINTALGALANYLISASETNFQPMHINWGLLAPIEAKKENRREEMAKRALNEIKEINNTWKL